MNLTEMICEHQVNTNKLSELQVNAHLHSKLSAKNATAHDQRSIISNSVFLQVPAEIIQLLPFIPQVH